MHLYYRKVMIELVYDPINLENLPVADYLDNDANNIVIIYNKKAYGVNKALFMFNNEMKRCIIANNAELAEILYNTAESLRALAVLLHPVMPEVTEKLWRSLGADKSIGDIKSQKISEVANWGQLPAGSTVTKTEVLFPRLEEAK